MGIGDEEQVKRIVIGGMDLFGKVGGLELEYEFIAVMMGIGFTSLATLYRYYHFPKLFGLIHQLFIGFKTDGKGSLI